MPVPEADCGEPLPALVPAHTSPGQRNSQSPKSFLHLSRCWYGRDFQPGIHLSQLTEELRVWSSHSTPSHRSPHSVSGLSNSAATRCSTPNGVAIHPIVWGVWEHKWAWGREKFAVVNLAICFEGGGDCSLSVLVSLLQVQTVIFPHLGVCEEQRD